MHIACSAVAHAHAEKTPVLMKIMKTFKGRGSTAKQFKMKSSIRLTWNTEEVWRGC